MVEAAGGRSLLGRSGDRSREVRWEDIEAVKADLVVVAPCGFRLDGAVAQAEELVASARLPVEIPVWALWKVPRGHRRGPVRGRSRLMLWKFDDLLVLDGASPGRCSWSSLRRPPRVVCQEPRLSDRGAQAALAVMTTVFALVLLSKMLLDSRVYHYGFVLALPAGVLMVGLCWTGRPGCWTARAVSGTGSARWR